MRLKHSETRQPMEKIMSDTKNKIFFEKDHRPILSKITFLESTQRQLSNCKCHFSSMKWPSDKPWCRCPVRGFRDFYVLPRFVSKMESLFFCNFVPTLKISQHFSQCTVTNALIPQGHVRWKKCSTVFQCKYRLNTPILQQGRQIKMNALFKGLTRGRWPRVTRNFSSV